MSYNNRKGFLNTVEVLNNVEMHYESHLFKGFAEISTYFWKEKEEREDSDGTWGTVYCLYKDFGTGGREGTSGKAVAVVNGL